MEPLEGRLLMSNTLLYWDANGATAGTGGTGTWNSSALVWRLGSATGTLQAWDNVDPSTTTAVFGGTASTVTVATATAINANSLQFDTSAVTVTGADATASIKLSGTTPTLTGAAATANLNAILTGTNGLTKTGSGTINLGGNNTFTGAIDVDAGQLNFNVVGAVGSASNAINVGDATAGQNAAAFFKAAGTGGTFSNAINVASGAGTRTVGQNGPTSGNYAGIVAGLITIAKDTTIQNTTGAANASNTWSGGIAGTGNVILASAGKANLITGALTFNGTLTNTGSASISSNLANNISAISNTGTGSLVIGGTSGYTGAYTVTSGNLAAGSATGFTASNTINLSTGATFNLKNPLGSSSQLFNVSVGAITGTGTVTNTGTSVRNLTLGSSSNSTFGGTITSAQLKLIKAGSGTVTLTGTSDFTQPTTVTAGTLIVSGALNNTLNTTVSGGSVLAGCGTIVTPVLVTSGIIDAGNSSSGTGVLNTGNLSFSSTGTLRGQINGSIIGDNFDQINVTGTVTLGSSILSLTGTRTQHPGHIITLIRNDGTDAVVGTFAGKAEGATVTVNGVNYTISYVGGTGNDVVLVDATVGALYDDSPWGLSIDSTRGKNFASWVPQTSATGSKWIRGLPVGWGVVEGTQGTFNFAVPDAQHAVAQANGQNLIGVFINPPSWTGEAGSFPVGHLTEWANYVTQVVNRYKSTVKYWEVWNEPPHYSDGDGTQGTPAEYAQIVTAAYNAAKAADPNAQIGIAGSSVNIEFIREAIVAGAAGKYDYLTLHPYEMLGGVKSSNWEGAYMSMVPSVRKMLADVDPTKVNVPIIFTEEGAVISGTTTQQVQAELLVKSFAMNIAQGVRQTDWFEGRDGDSGQFGLLDAAGAQRTQYVAFDTMINYLGQYPQYLGWVLLNNQDYGFVFQGPTENVMVTWAPVGVTDTVNFGATVNIINPSTAGVTSASSYALTNSPVIVTALPDSIVATAKANKLLAFPWQGNYTGATSVAFVPNNTPRETGLHLMGGAANFLNVGGEIVYNASTSSQTNFAVDPNFLSYTGTPIYITVVAKRIVSGTAAGFNLKYESAAQQLYKNSSSSWWTVPSGTGWSTKTYTINDPQFVGMWGYNFRLDGDTIGNSGYYLKSVTVSLQNPLTLAGAEGNGAKAISAKDVKPTLLAAESLWKNAGYDTSAFSDVTVQIEDLAGTLLAVSNGSTITLDADAAGHGWSTKASGVAKGKVDLLSALSHELGHVLGLDHATPGVPVMNDTLATGVRSTDALVGKGLTAGKWFAV